MPHPLDNPVHAALLGPQQAFLETRGAAVRYPAEVAPFVGLPSSSGSDAWGDLAALLGSGQWGALVGDDNPLPRDWNVVERLVGVQMTAPGAVGLQDPGFVTLGEADVPEMLALTKATKPGPFFSRTHELGHYVGLRDGGALVAMAGERMHLPGHTEISAVCTASTHRGRGLASRLVNHLVAEIAARGEVPFLHAVLSNTGAIRLYESLGFAVRRPIDFTLVTAPGERAPGGPPSSGS